MKLQRKKFMLSEVEKGSNLMLRDWTQWQHWMTLNSSQQPVALALK